MDLKNKSNCLIENFIVIWADSNLSVNNNTNIDIQKSINSFRKIVNSIKTFNSFDLCIDFIENYVKEDKVFLITSGKFADKIIPRIKYNVKMSAIYIFCVNKSKYEKWINDDLNNKIKGIFTDIETICDKLKCDIKQCENEMTTINLLSKSMSKQLNHLDASFMYSQLLKEILLSVRIQNVNEFQRAKQDFAEFCRNQYSENDQELSFIEEFDNNYSSSSAIWWYTRQCFLYSMLNRSLRALNLDVLIKLSFYICDLHRQIEQIHRTMNKQHILTVYRGQGMLRAAFNRVKQNENGLLSFNSFLSTSTSKQVAMAFARNSFRKPGRVAVLFEMKIDPTIPSEPFASLDKFSYFRENEKEILFSMNTVFRINNIKPFEDNDQLNLWIVQLTLTNVNDEELRQLTEHMKLDLSFTFIHKNEFNLDPLWRLSRLFVNMGDYDKAQVSYEIILDKAKTENNFKVQQETHYQLVELFALYKNNWNRAKEHLNEMFRVGLPDPTEIVQESMQEFMLLFSSLRDLLIDDQVDESQFRSHMIKLITRLIDYFLNYTVQPLSSLEYQLIVDRYNFLGSTFKKQGNLHEAIHSHQQALQLLHQHLPKTHPRLAITYNYLSSIYLLKNDYLNALEYLDKALDIQEKVLPVNHLHIGETHFRMSIIFQLLNNLDESLHHAHKAIDIVRQSTNTLNDSQFKTYREHYDKICQLHNQFCQEIVF